MGIALVSHEFPPFMFGGIASVCFDLASSLAKNNIPVTVFSGRSRKIKEETLQSNLKVIRLPFLNYPSRPLWFQLYNYRTLFKLLRAYPIIHGINPQSSAICGYIKKKLRKPFVVSMHDVFLSELKIFINSPFSDWNLGDFGLNVLEYPINEYLIKSCLKNSDYTIVHGFNTLNEMRNIYSNFNFERVSVVLNGINFDKLNLIENPTIKGDQSNDLSIMYFGRLFYRKGVLHLIKAFNLLALEFPNLKLNIFGMGPLKKKIENLISDLKLEKRILLRGYVPYHNLIQEVRRSDIVSFPSLFEASPIAPLEAMACQKPVVAFNFPFMREIINNMNNGVLAKAGDINDLYLKIRMLLYDEKLRHKIGRNAYKYVKQKHNWDSLVKKYIDIYEQVLP